MALDADDEILQDFLVEASEILEQLNEQLVDLEQAPEDTDLLNAVFRGFHTIKGGAGFLNLTPLVDVCHRAEDVFNLLRNGEKQVTPQLMDTMLPVLDVLNDQFESLRALEEPTPAQPELLAALEALVHEPEGEPEPAPSEAAAAPAEPAAGPPVTDASGAAAQMVSGDITDEEFEALLDALDSDKGSMAQGGGAEEPKATGADEEITEEEFEALLDELHGPGKHGGRPESAPQAGRGTDDEITEEEFDALLDELHGKGQHGGVPRAQDAAPAGAAPAQADKKDEEITEEEFESLLDELHGKGKHGGAPREGGAVAKPAGPAAAPAPTKTPPAAGAAGGGGAKPPAAGKPAAPGGGRKKPDAHPPQTETTVRVDTKRLDDIMNLVGELVLVRNRLSTLAGRDDYERAREELSKTVANLDVVTGDLQTGVMKTRMQPIKKVFGRFPRVVRDLARSLKKEVNLVMEGEETDLDKNLVEALADPLVHLVRNAVDHGIEQPEEREARGKPRQGTLRLAAEQEGDHILLIIEDDGAGMDPDVLRKKAVEKGMMDEDAAARLDNKDAYALIFAAGFSTKQEISDISGRGVGMDVVKTRIAQLNGSIDIDSDKGKGTRLAIKVPLTLAIMPTLMVKLREQTFALPLVNVNEIFHLDLTKTNIVDGQRVIIVREKALPLFYLAQWLTADGGNETFPREGHVVMVHVGTQQIGFVVDELIGQEEVVIKPLGAFLHGTDGMAGATITGDGKIALILDVPSLLKAYAHR